MAVSLELLLDGASEQLVRSEWEALEARGHSSLAAHRSPSNRPHLTLAEGLDGSEVDAIDWTAFTLPLAVSLGAPVLFGSGDRRVLARSVTPTLALLELHAAVHSALSQADARTRPGDWMPHVTLARRVRLETLADALGCVGEEIPAQFITIRSWNPETRIIEVRAGEPTVSRE